MAFQFLCPQGHLLQGDEASAGQQCKCPYCGSLFLMPSPPPAPAVQVPPAVPGPPAFQQPPAFSPPPVPDPPVFQQPPAFQPPPGFQPRPGFQASVGQAPADWQPNEGGQVASAPEGAAGPNPGAPAEAPGPAPAGPVEIPGSGLPALVHVICPSGHELETPREMLGREAMCPYCQVQFTLRYEDSVEYRKEQAEELERLERRRAKLWLHWSIAIAVVVVGGVVALVVMAASL